VAPTAERDAVAAITSIFRRVDRPSLFAIASGALLLVAVVRAAWSCDDAFITLRTVDNWVDGFGLRWNVSERVQSYTHPLWLFAVALVYLPARSASFALLLPGLVATAGFIVWFVRRASDRRLAGALLLVLLASKAFVEFSTAGLENPLVHLLLLGYCAAVASSLQTSAGLGRTFLFAAGLLLTRMDVIWLIGPSLVFAAWRARGELKRAATWSSLLPLAAWHLFSFVYYGFWFPNTAYAKLNTSVPFDEALAQGLRYLGAHLAYDPITPGAIALGLVVGLARRRPLGVALAVGLLLWHAFWVSIGGDFMIGRMLTPPLVVAVIILLECAPARSRRFAPFAAAALVVAAVLLPRTALLGPPRRPDRGWLPERVTDERALFHSVTGLLGRDGAGDPGSHPWVRAAMKDVARGQRVIRARSVGLVGYYLGPRIHIVDEFALCDPLLARLPANPAWSPGHFERTVPDGYLATLRTGDNQLREPVLRRRYTELSAIVSGPVFSTSRLATALRWAFRPPAMVGPDYLVSHVAEAALAGAPGDGAPVGSAGVRTPEKQGMLVELAAPARVQELEVAVGGDDRYEIALRRDGEVVWHEWVAADPPLRGRLRTYALSFEESPLIDAVRIRGRGGDYKYHVGRVHIVRAR
jgi:arabinofuranosyltransferase